LQYSRNQQRLVWVFEEAAALFTSLAGESMGRSFIETSFLYVDWTTDLTKQQVVAIFHRISQQTGAAAMTTAERACIATHLTDDLPALALKLAKRTDIDGPKVVAQIQARQKARTKLPTWYANPNVVFPPPLSVEQASSDLTAAYKASLVSGTYLIDLTGGMGVDTAAFSAHIQQVTYLERQPDVANTAAYNFAQLGLNTIDLHVGDGLTYLTHLTQPANWLYLDPARRNSKGGRVVSLADCEPNVLTYLPLLLEKGQHVLIKTSPLLDIEATLRQLPACEAVHVVAVQGEVKELLFVLNQANLPPGGAPSNSAVQMTAIDLRENGPAVSITYRRADEASSPVALADPQTYLYEPNAAVLKAGAFRLVGWQFGLAKLAPHSHLYTAPHYVPGFPGRTFQLIATCKADQKALREYVPAGKANLTVRNFPQTVETLRKQLALREGGDTYLFATTLQNGDKRLLITRKVLP
jgi:16S rRNA G966 N2-methylase RsmD